MKNWSIDIKELKKDKGKYAVWRLEQMVNFGLDGQKLDGRELKKYWSKLRIDPRKKKYLAMLLGIKEQQDNNN
jgi:hypothetical protein